MSDQTEPNRRQVLAGMCGVAAATALGALPYARQAAAQASPPAGSTRRPNILYIFADDLGYGELGCFGNPLVQTPHLDRMAADGMRLTDHYCGSPVCAPSRCVLMTGLHTGHCTRRGNRIASRPLVPLAADDLTVAQVLQQAGYATGMFGKWGLGNPHTTGSATAKGWDRFIGFADQVHAHDHFTGTLMNGDEYMEIPENEGQHRGVYVNDLFTRFAEAFIREQAAADKPFFCYLPTTLPHAPYKVPELGDYADKPWSDRDKALASMITRMDGYVGRLRAVLEELNIAHNTLVFFTSDNGPEYADAPLRNHTPFRGEKRSMYEGGLRVPAVAWWPGKIPAGSLSSGMSWTCDFMATATELAGAPCPKTDGVSMIPQLTGRPEPQREYLYWEGFGHQVVRVGQMKGLLDLKSGLFELYDLGVDPGETVNLAADHSGLVAEMRQIMAREHEPSADFPLLPQELSSFDDRLRGRVPEAGTFAGMGAPRP